MFIFSSNKTPKALFLAILMVVFFEGAVLYFDNELYVDLRNGPFAKIKNELSMLPGSNLDVLFMGDCYNQTGVDPRVFDYLTKLSSFNFSTDAYHTVLSSYVMLKNYLQVNINKPKYVFIGFLPAIWSQDKEDIIQNYLFVFADYKYGNISLLIKEFGLMNTFKLFIPILKHQDFLRKTTLSNLFKRFKFKKDIDQTLIEYVFKNNGAFLPYEWGNSVKVTDPPKQCGDILVVSPFFKKYMEKMLELSFKNNVIVYYIVPSAPPAWALQIEECSSNRDILDYLNTLKLKYKNLTVLNPQKELDNNKFYFNELHFNYRGSREFSKYLANVINH